MGERTCRRCGVGPVRMFLTAACVALVGISQSRGASPLQITFEDVPGVRQATTAIGTGFDSTLGTIDVVHAAWAADEAIYYRSGSLGNLSPKRLVSRSGRERGVDPVLAVSNSGKLTLVWSAEITRNADIVPGEWNLLITHAPDVAPSFLTEDDRTGPTTLDSHPTLAVRRDSVYVAWERGTPSQIYFTLLTDAISANNRVLVRVTDNPYPSVRPYISRGAGGAYWIVWTSFAGAGNGDVWASRVGGQRAFSPPMPVRLGPADDRSPALAVDRDGRPHIVWQEGANGGPIRYVYGLLGGGFSPIVTLTPPGVVAQNPQIVIGSDDVPHVLWQNADGGLDMTTVFGTTSLPPVHFMPGSYSPRQRVEGIAEMWPGVYVTPWNRFIVAFIAPDETTQVRNIWMAFGTEESAGVAVTRLTAEQTPYGDGVRIRWKSSAAGVNRFDVFRRSAEGKGIGAANISTVPARNPVGGAFAAVDEITEAGSYVYRVDAVDEFGLTIASDSVKVKVKPRAPGIRLRAAPNPFNGETSLIVATDRDAVMCAEVFGVAGRRVRTFARDARLSPGVHRIVWDGRDGEGRTVASGAYFAVFRFVLDDGSITRKAVRLTLLR